MNLCDKERYETHQLAIHAADEIGKRDKVSMRVYYHKDCNGYHLATAGKKKFIKNIRHGITPVKEIKPNRRSRKQIQEQHKQEYATEKMISPELAAHLKRLIEGKNQMDKQANKFKQ